MSVQTQLYKRQYQNKLCAVVEELPHLGSVSIGIFVGIGARHEPQEYNGISHFLEHMLFKGTKKRTATQIAEALDRIGGELNATTNHEGTCYYAKVRAEHLPVAFDILVDILFESLLSQEEVERERRVILEEIARHEDNPDELIHDILLRNCFEHNLGQPILGTAKTINSISRDALYDYLKKYYQPQNMIVAVAGGVNHAQVFNMIETSLSKVESHNGKIENVEDKFIGGKRVVCNRKLEQVHLCVALPGVKYTDERKYTFKLLSLALGGGMSSRLFQQIRERRGLAYAIHAYPLSFRDVGILVIYAGTHKNTFLQLLDVLKDELRKLSKDGLSEDELIKVKEQAKAAVVFSLENTKARMMLLIEQQFYYETLFEIKQIFAKIDAVSNDDIVHLSNNLLREESLSVAAIGPIAQQIFNS